MKSGRTAWLRWGNRPLHFRGGSTELTIVFAIALAGLAYFSHEPRVQLPTGTYLSGCHEARALGAAPIYAGEPGYREELDGDSDGIACEPIRY